MPIRNYCYKIQHILIGSATGMCLGVAALDVPTNFIPMTCGEEPLKSHDVSNCVRYRMKHMDATWF